MGFGDPRVTITPCPFGNDDHYTRSCPFCQEKILRNYDRYEAHVRAVVLRSELSPHAVRVLFRSQSKKISPVYTGHALSNYVFHRYSQRSC